MCPIYEFKCEKCSNVKEELMSITSDVRELPCAICGNIAKRIISKNTFHLEGGGWASDGYVTKAEKFKANMKAVDDY